jgi:hypothetical protein
MIDFIFCLCEAKFLDGGDGRGGGIYVGLKGTTTIFTLTRLNFTNNKDNVGKDLFFTCASLSSSVTSPHFDLHSSVTEKENTLMGEDSSPFVSPVSLFIFLNGYFGSSVSVSLSDGDDALYCGMSVSPCSSLLNEAEHFGGVNGRKEMNMKGYRDMTKRQDLSNVNMKSNSTATIVLTFQNNLEGSETNATDNTGSLSFSFFDFSCGSC